MTVNKARSPDSDLLALVVREVHINKIDHVATGEVARKSRLETNISLTKVAYAMGVSKTYLSDLERGKRPWSEPLLKSFERAVRQLKGEGEK